MIPRSEIIYWRINHDWLTDDQVEQDFLLSRAICAISDDAFLSSELVFRGGTAYHKLFLPEPMRYSEDLDYVRTTAGAIGDIMKRLTSLGIELGFDVRTKPGKYPKILWRYVSEAGTSMKIKIEINTFERSPIFELQKVPFSLETPLCNTVSEVLTFQVEELVATKLRALYQRSKGRDLFDLWLALTNLSLDPKVIMRAFPIYRPDGLSRKTMEENIKDKLNDAQFRNDMNNLMRSNTIDYDIDKAAELVMHKLIALL